ncbi:DUF4269 domain-containing protein [Leptospira sp. WS92.C1]
MQDRKFKEKIKDLKRKGWKTEPAFCNLLHIREDPYQFLYDLRLLSDNELERLIFHFDFFTHTRTLKCKIRIQI